MTPAIIAHLLPWPIVGGGEIATMRLVQAIQQDRQFRCLAFCPGADTDVARAFEHDLVESIPYTPTDFSYRRGWRYFQHALRLARQFRAHHVDLVHCSDLMGAYHAALAARLAGIPVI